MYKKIFWLILLPITLTTVFSCKKLLEIEETDFIGGSNALRTVKDNEALLISAYATLGAGTPPTPSPDTRTEYEMAIKLNGILSDELKNDEFYASQTMHEWLYAPSEVAIRDQYMANVTYYRVVDRVNRVLEALPEAIAEESGDEELRTKVRGEALFLRAFAHFELFRYYCGNYDPAGLGMPYLEQSTLENQARINMGEYFSKIQRDVAEAKPLLLNDLSDVNRANRLTASALQARIALYTRAWEDAVTYSSEYIAGIPLSPRSEFNGIWKDQNNNELSWKLPRNTSNRLGSFYRGTFTPALQPGTLSWVPSLKLWNSFDQNNDIRFEAYLIDEPLLSAAGKTSKIVHKYSGTGYGTTSENVAAIKIFRTAEMYLIRAEARAETGAFTGANSAESDINELRAARINGYTNENFASQQQAIDAVLQERFKELAFEGHRFWDLKRRGLPVERLAEDAPSPAAATLPANNFRFVMPIPQSEMLANPLMEQNPGYAQ